MKIRPAKRHVKGRLMNRLTVQRFLLLVKADIPTHRLFLTVLFGAASISCQRLPEHRLSIGTSIDPAYECLYLARSLGPHDNPSARLVELPSDSSVLRAFRNELIDAAALTMDEAFLLAAQGHDLKVVLVLNLSKTKNVILGQPNIKSIEGLRQKRIGAECTASAAYTLAQLLEQGGLSPSDVSIVLLEADELEEAFNQGAIDAVITTNSAGNRLLTNGAHPLLDSALKPEEVTKVLVVRQEALQTYKTELKKVAASWFKAIEHLKEHPNESAASMAPRTGMTTAELLISLEAIRFPAQNVNQILLAGKDPSFTRSLNRLSFFMSQRGLLPHPVNPRLLLTEELIQEDK